MVDPWRWQLEKVVNLMKVMDSHENHKAFVQMAKRLERMSMGACSAPSPTRLGHTFAKHKKYSNRVID